MYQFKHYRSAFTIIIFTFILLEPGTAAVSSKQCPTEARVLIDYAMKKMIAASNRPRYENSNWDCRYYGNTSTYVVTVTMWPKDIRYSFEYFAIEISDTEVKYLHNNYNTNYIDRTPDENGSTPIIMASMQKDCVDYSKKKVLPYCKL